MASKTFKALCWLVYFLINEIHSSYQQDPVSQNNINGCIIRNTEQKILSLSNLCEDFPKILKGQRNGVPVINDQIKEGPKGNETEQQKGDQKEEDDGSSVITKTASGVFCNTDPKLPKTDMNCWYVEITNKKCKERKNCESDAVFFTGVIVVAVLGGTVFGSVITTIVFFCFCRAFLFPKIRNSDCKPRSDENLQESVRPVDNETVYNEINDQAVIRLQPMRRPESPHVSSREETYSHLHESDKEDMNESYDHARPVSSCCVTENRYEVLTRVGNNNREDQTTATDDVPSKIQSDNYFIIEPQ